MNKIEFEGLNEKLYHETLDNGLDIYIYKKPGFYKKSAYFTTKYGSNNYEFKPIDESEIRKFPKGIAHFLEHKLFESNDDENTFIKFRKYGANVNAYTCHTETCYYFNTINNFYECLNLLIDFVQKPYITDENVEKEKGIICREIDMSKDKISRRIYERQASNVFFNNPNKYNTIGEKEDVNSITKEDLYKCYNTFYHPSNMILSIAGDIDVDKTINLIKENQKKKNYKKNETISNKTYDEPKNVVKEYDEIKLNVSEDRIDVCYKLAFPKRNAREIILNLLYINFFIKLKFGFLTDFDNELMKNNIIKSYFDYFYYRQDDYLLIRFQADTLNKEKFINIIDKKINDFNFNKDEFNLIKKSIINNMLRKFENPSNVAKDVYNDLVLYGEVITFDYELCKNISYDEFVNYCKNLDLSNKTVLLIKKRRK